MDVGLIILAATFVLLVIALVSFVSSVVRARRASRFAGPLQEVDMSPRGVGGPVDTSLEGLKVEVSADSLSASLLTPLRAGEWMPPAAPAPAESLAEASLTERIAGFEPLPNVPEPAFSVEQYEPWEVEASAAGLPVRQPTVVAPVIPLAASVPEVAVSAPEPLTGGATDLDLDLELAALIPSVAVPIVEIVPATPAPMPPVIMPEPAPSPAVAEPESAAPIPLEPPAAPAPVVAAVTAAAPVVAAVTPPMPVPLASPGVPEESSSDEYWEDLLREQVPESPRAQTRVVEPRPEVRVAAADPPPAPEPIPAVAARPIRPRPVARVKSVEGQILEFAPEALAVDEMQTVAGRTGIPELVMEAPVEMWFGEARVGVKAGTATYDRFRKYADVLLADLRGASTRIS